MIELIIVILLLYVSYKLSRQEALMKQQNDLIEELQDMQKNCKNHVERLEKIHKILS